MVPNDFCVFQITGPLTVKPLKNFLNRKWGITWRYAFITFESRLGVSCLGLDCQVQTGNYLMRHWLLQESCLLMFLSNLASLTSAQGFPFEFWAIRLLIIWLLFYFHHVAGGAVLSAPPTMNPLPLHHPEPGTGDAGVGGSSGTTIEAKPQLKNLIGDATRFVPTSLKVRRTVKDSRGRLIQVGGGISSSGIRMGNSLSPSRE